MSFKPTSSLDDDKPRRILSDLTVFMKYAKYREDLKRRETWDELVDRNVGMHTKKYPHMKDEIIEVYDKFVRTKKVLPSMRSFQFAGKAIEVNPARIFNCACGSPDDPYFYAEAMFLLLGGTGLGYLVTKDVVNKLPTIHTPLKTKYAKRYVVGDSIEGWASAIEMLVNSYFYEGKREVEFDFSGIRPKGARLVTAGGHAPGPAPLQEAIIKIKNVFQTAIVKRGEGTKLKPIEVHDQMCFIADAVLAGGIRRSAMIVGFSPDDEEMITCKSGNWWEQNPQRGRANNSVVLVRETTTKEQFDSLWEKVEASNAGEPGFYWTNESNNEYFTNPCQPSWAKVLTPEGIREFKNIQEGSKIWSKEGWTTVVKKWKTGVKPVYRYATTRGVFYGTENHRVVSQGEKVEVKEAESIEFLRGIYGSESISLDPRDIMSGLVLGDGTVHKASNNRIQLYIGSKDQDYFNSEIAEFIGKQRSHQSGTLYDVVSCDLNHDEIPHTYRRRIPERFLKNPTKLVGLLRGLYTANGSVVDSRVTYKTASKGMAEDIQLALSSLGISGYITINKPTNVTFKNGEYLCKESFDVNISVDRNKFLETIGFIQNYKMEKLAGIPKKSNDDKYPDSDIKEVTLISEEEVWDITVDNESHTYWTQGCNVSNCCEISLKANGGFCNLTEIRASDIESQQDFNDRAKAGAFIGTLQAGYSSFHFLREVWRKNAEEEALLGVSMTGIASMSIFKYDIEQASRILVEENKRVANMIGINPAKRIGAIKPSGTTSLTLGTSSGIHAYHDNFYMRRIRIDKNESLYKYLSTFHSELVEDEFFAPHKTAVISVPQKAPEGSVTRNESPFDLLERVKTIANKWIVPSHQDGPNTHNVSVTVSLKDEDWAPVGEWMWNNRSVYNGISVLPFSGGSYPQLPFETITKEEYEAKVSTLYDIDLTMVIEEEDNTDLQGEAACAGASCEVK